MRTLISAVALLLATTAAADTATSVVSVSSLDVKERIRTMEQINVSAETDQVAEQPTTSAVAELLDEATEIESEAEQPAE